MKTQTPRFNEKPTLPEDIIATEILPRLSSIESLLKFKCVSKSWCSFISTEYFAKTQLQKSPPKTSAIIMWNYFSDFWVNHCHVADLFSQQYVDLVQFKFAHPSSSLHPINSIHSTRLVGCCNGLCCLLWSEQLFILFNPATRKFHELPPVCDQDTHIGPYGYGESNGDYKVFVSISEAKSPYARVFKLYSLKTNSWKTVEGPDVPPYQEPGVVVNGKLHWKPSDRSCLKIVSFDLGTELVGAIELPSIEGMNWSGALCVLQGCLCIVNDDYSGYTVVHIMKEYGVKKSWHKVLSFSWLGIDSTYDSFYEGSPIPICISEEGEVLIHHKRLFIYNPNSDSFRRVEVDEPHSDLLTYPYDIGIYAPSLASPFPPSE